MTCAAPPAYSFGTFITFSYGARQVTCKVNDRGGAIQGSHFDLSRAAATTLGMIHAGEVNGKFVVVSGSGNANPAANQNSSNANNSSSGAGGTSLLDLLTGSVGSIGDTLALIGIEIIKDLAIGIADYIIIPFWHWNQRAVSYYEQQELFKPTEHPYSMFAAAGFWGFGYWLLWTDPDSGSLRAAPVRGSRLARHVRGLQSIPARRTLIKPRDVKERTPTKPKPHISRVTIRQTGTMGTHRPTPVRVTGTHTTEESNGRNNSRLPLESTGTAKPNKREGSGTREAARKTDTTRTKSNARDRTRSNALRSSGGSASRSTESRSRGRGDS